MQFLIDLLSQKTKYHTHTHNTKRESERDQFVNGQYEIVVRIVVYD